MTYRNKAESIKAIRKCGEKCVICGWAETAPNGDALVEGCHLYDFSEEPSYDTFRNIVAMCPNHHTEFDKNCFYIDSRTHEVVYYPGDKNDASQKLDIDYVDNRFLAYRQSRIIKYWNTLPKQ